MEGGGSRGHGSLVSSHARLVGIRGLCVSRGPILIPHSVAHLHLQTVALKRTMLRRCKAKRVVSG